MTTETTPQSHAQHCLLKAAHLAGLLRAAQTVDNEGTCSDGLTSILHFATEVTEGLCRDLEAISG